MTSSAMSSTMTDQLDPSSMGFICFLIACVLVLVFAVALIGGSDYLSAKRERNHEANHRRANKRAKTEVRHLRLENQEMQMEHEQELAGRGLDNNYALLDGPNRGNEFPVADEQNRPYSLLYTRAMDTIRQLSGFHPIGPAPPSVTAYHELQDKCKKLEAIVKPFIDSGCMDKDGKVIGTHEWRLTPGFATPVRGTPLREEETFGRASRVLGEGADGESPSRTESV